MRTLPLLPAVKDILLNLKREQQERAEKYGQYYNRQYRDYICVDEIGKLIRPDTLTTHFKSFLVRNNLPVIRFHELRHSCASILIASGVSMKAVQEWLGHSTFSTTADIYSHLNFSSKLGIADTLSDILAGNTTLKRQTAPDTIETMQKIPRPIMPTIYLFSKKRKKKCRGSVWKRLTNTLNISTFRNACKSAAISQRIWRCKPC